MWLSQQFQTQQAQEEPGGFATVSIGGTAPGALYDCQHTDLAVLSPGGYAWSAAVGQAVLLLPGQSAMAGILQPGPVKLQPGEVCLYSDKASIVLRNSGAIELTGTVYLNGVPLEG